MTPLALKFFRQLTLPTRQRITTDYAGCLEKLDDLHCFEMSAVAEAVNRAIEQEQKPVIDTCAALIWDLFLPSPRTWLEYRHGADGRGVEGERSAVIIEPVTSKESTKYLLSLVIEEPLSSVPIGMFWAQAPVEGEHITAWYGRPMIQKGFNDQFTPDQRRAQLNRFVVETLLFLDMINTPGLVGLKQHDPHRGFERDLRRAAGVGRYPLRAWSEVLIKAHSEDASDAEHDTGLTGRKCLHFVRAHRRRFQDGSQTRVTHHWRGDPALGIKRTRYRVEH